MSDYETTWVKTIEYDDASRVIKETNTETHRKLAEPSNPNETGIDPDAPIDLYPTDKGIEDAVIGAEDIKAGSVSADKILPGFLPIGGLLKDTGGPYLMNERTSGRFSPNHPSVLGMQRRLRSGGLWFGDDATVEQETDCGCDHALRDNVISLAEYLKGRDGA